MRIGFIGAGKVGFTFGKYITTKMVVSKPEHIQLEVSGYYSAHSESAADAAEFTETVMYNSLEELCRSYLSYCSRWTDRRSLEETKRS